MTPENLGSSEETTPPLNPVPPLDPQLGAAASGELEAIRNDLEQAKQLASDYQRLLAGKSNEVAALRQIFEKTRSDLLNLHHSITKLREERHVLANQALKAVALELVVGNLTEERDRFKNEAEALRRVRGRENDAFVADLVQQIAALKRDLAAARDAMPLEQPIDPPLPNVLDALEVLPTPRMPGARRAR